MPRARTPQKRTTTKPTVAEPDDVVDAVIVDDDDPEAVAAEIGANLAVPWDERKAELAAEALIARSLAWHATARALLSACKIDELARHIDGAADWLPGPTKLRRLIPIEVDADLAARYMPAMRPDVNDGLDHLRYAAHTAAAVAPPRADLVNGSDERWPLLSELLGDGEVDTHVFGAAR